MRGALPIVLAAISTRQLLARPLPVRKAENVDLGWLVRVPASLDDAGERPWMKRGGGTNTAASAAATNGIAHVTSPSSGPKLTKSKSATMRNLAQWKPPFLAQRPAAVGDGHLKGLTYEQVLRKGGVLPSDSSRSSQSPRQANRKGDGGMNLAELLAIERKSERQHTNGDLHPELRPAMMQRSQSSRGVTAEAKFKAQGTTTEPINYAIPHPELRKSKSYGRGAIVLNYTKQRAPTLSSSSSQLQNGPSKTTSKEPPIPASMKPCTNCGLLTPSIVQETARRVVKKTGKVVQKAKRRTAKTMRAIWPRKNKCTPPVSYFEGLTPIKVKPHILRPPRPLSRSSPASFRAQR